MIKHIITTDCQRNCAYCISRNINIKEYDSKDYVDKLAAAYFKFYKKHKQIMLTGGEPTESKHLYDCWNAASIIFDEVFITSANSQILHEPKSASRFNAITFSWHDLNANNFQKITNGAVVYCGILSSLFTPGLAEALKELGYAGLTINENHYGTEVFDESRLPQIENFSIKINRRGKCINDGTVYIMPDLSIRENFEEFL